jgi:endonuclease III
VRPKEFKPGSLGANCGEVPSVLDALVRTILSQNTNNKNSSTAKHSLDKTFGLGNYQAVREAPLEDIVEALRCGGLANIKGARIKRILDEVYCKYGKLSLDHLHGVSDEDAKRELMQYDGVGPKTAFCVLLFCLRRDSFAVDTHVVCSSIAERVANGSLVSHYESVGLGSAQG